MPSRSRGASLAVLIALLTLGAALPAAAAEVDSSDIVLITEDDVVEGDLYVAANRVIVRGTLDGDLVAIAGQDIRIEGEVTGSVFAIAAEVVVTGTVGGSIRAASPTVDVSGAVGRDLVTLAWSFGFAGEGLVRGDVVVWGWDASSAGAIFGDLEGSMRRLAASGEIGGDVKVSVTELDIPGPLVVEGDLTYRSRDDASGLDHAEVDGIVVRQEPTTPNIRLRALGLAARVVVAVLLSAVALLVASAWPERTERALDGLRTSPVRSILSGTAVFVSPLLIVGLAIALFALAPATAALPLVAALIPVLFATLGVVLVLGFIAGIPAVAWLGSRIKRQSTIAGAVGLGSLLVAIVWLIPVVGWVAALLVSIAGLGGWISTVQRWSGDAVPVEE